MNRSSYHCGIFLFTQLRKISQYQGLCFFQPYFFKQEAKFHPAIFVLICLISKTFLVFEALDTLDKYLALDRLSLLKDVQVCEVDYQPGWHGGGQDTG